MREKLGIIGIGRIGQAFAKRAIAFGMDIQYCNRHPVPPHIENELEATFIPLYKSNSIKFRCS